MLVTIGTSRVLGKVKGVNARKLNSELHRQETGQSHQS